MKPNVNSATMTPMSNDYQPGTGNRLVTAKTNKDEGSLSHRPANV